MTYFGSELCCSDESDDEDDDELELQRELEQIRRDREQAQAKKLEEEKVASEKQKTETAIRGNPLMNLDGSARVINTNNRCIAVVTNLLIYLGETTME